MITTGEIVVTKKLKIKFSTKRIEAEPGNKSCGLARNESHVREWDKCTSSNDQSTHGTFTLQRVPVARSSGNVFSANRVKVESPTLGAKKRGSSGVLEDPHSKRQRMDRGMTHQCSRILKKLMTHPAGWVFNQPVDPEKLNIPDYFSVISEPMDLGTIKSKLEKKLYFGPGEFVSDIRLTFSNAMLYNPSSNNVHLMAKELNNLFSTSWKSLDAKWNYESFGVKEGNVLNGKARPAEVKLTKTTETCGSKLVKKKFHKDTLVIPASLKCGFCGNTACQCGADNGSTCESSSGLSSITQDYTATDFHAPKLIASEETHPCCRQASLTLSSKSDPDSDGGVSPVVENIFPSSHDSAPITAASSGEEWRISTIGIQLSPKRALRAALLKRRFADTILKAQHRTLLDHGDKSDPEKLQREKERLEKKQQEEKDRIKAEILAAEAASRMKAESELKMQREKEREAARIAVQKMEKTVEIDENLPSLKDLEFLSGFSPDIEGEISCVSFLSPRSGNPLERLGLFMKDEYLGNEEDDEDMILNGGSGEEGEIIN